MKLIYDIGMYDGADTEYYLRSGHRVVAVEANPNLVARARERFREPIAAGQLVCVNAAISEDGRDVELQLSGKDLGASSLFSEWVADRDPAGTVRAPGTTLAKLFAEHGRPYYLKVDIEGADRLCVLSLTRDARPDFLSFEVGPDAEELLAHAAAVGYTRFKLINQVSFRELANHLCLQDRLRLRLLRMLGFKNPAAVNRGGEFFNCGHSSGPVPWKSDGHWFSHAELVRRFRAASAANQLSGWFDVHATA